MSAAVYVNRTKNDILFTEDRSARYTATNPPPGWPLPPARHRARARRAAFPARFTYLNFGHVTQKGLELGVDTWLGNRTSSLFVNYSWQGEPGAGRLRHQRAEPAAEEPLQRRRRLQQPPRARRTSRSATRTTRSGRTCSTTGIHGTTEAYTLVNGGFGLKWFNNQLTTSVKVINLANEEVQQHVFGDVLKRQVVGELRVTF